MCNDACVNFVANTVKPEEVAGKAVIESGSQDVNGSTRSIFERLGASRYVGTDIVPGVRVDQICNAVNLVETFGAKSFDVLVSTEMVEHVEDWRTVISNFKRILKPGGVLFITTRSQGFGYHGYPKDFWRYEVEDMQAIFSDFEVLVVQSDPSEPGVFVKARRPKRFREKNLKEYQLYSINAERRTV